MKIPQEALAELAPGGKLRVGLNTANFLLVLNDAGRGEPQGIAPDLARELARRLGVAVEFIRFDQPSKLADAVRDGACDAGFLAIEEQRAARIAFSPAYVEIPATYIVPAASPISRVEEVDRAGVRIAVPERSAYELWLSRNLRHATLVRAEGLAGAYRAFLEAGLEALAGLRPAFIADAHKLPGGRLLDGRFTAVQQAIGTAKNRKAAAGCLAAYVAAVKASGFAARVIEKHAVRGLSVPRAYQGDS
jgi:polar amino acid transport system substrate-binding protein